MEGTRDPQEWISCPFFIAVFFLKAWRRETNGKTKEGKGSAATSPALVSPFGIPLPRRPLCKEWPKGETHPHFGEKGKVVLAYVVPGGVAQTLRGLPFGSHPLQSFFLPPHRRPGEGRGGPQRPDGAGQRGKGRAEALGFRARKIAGLKAKGFVIFPLPTLYLSSWVCGKAAYVSEHSSGFATPSAPKGLPGTDKKPTKRKGRAKGKAGVFGAIAGV
jgi:hypothetical protein